MAAMWSPDGHRLAFTSRAGLDLHVRQSTGDDGGASAAAGGSATAAAPTRQVVVPTAAVHAEGGRDVVWIVRNGAVERRAVTLGLPNGREVAVLGGLSGGETLVVDGPDTLTDGALVTEQQS